MNAVCYLVKSGHLESGLIFPTEMTELDTATTGSFYLLARSSSATEDAYAFFAVRGERILRVVLERMDKARSFFRAQVPDVGAFMFYAQPMPRKIPYRGDAPQFQDHVAIRRLRSWRPNDLENACAKYEFYFVGYSPRLDGENG